MINKLIRDDKGYHYKNVVSTVFKRLGKKKINNNTLLIHRLNRNKHIVCNVMVSS